MKEDIRLLLDRFYRGVTSIEDEQRLIQYLLSDNCPEELLAERHAVISLARPEAIRQPDRLEQRIVEAIQSDSEKHRWWIGMAVGLLILIGIGFWALLPKDGQPHPAKQKMVAEAAKLVVTEPISPSAMLQPDEPTTQKQLAVPTSSKFHKQTAKPATSQKAQKSQESTRPTDLLEIDLAAEVADLVANIDQLEQQIIVTETQNNH